MDILTIFQAIYNINPDAKYSMAGSDISTITWKDDHTGVTPSTAEIQAEYDAIIAAKPQAEVDANRLAAYQKESDPLYFKWKAGEATEQQWLDKRAEIKTRYPNA